MGSPRTGGCRHTASTGFLELRVQWPTGTCLEVVALAVRPRSKKGYVPMRFGRAMLVSLICLAAGCTWFIPKESLYLVSALDRTSQDEVQQHFGNPRAVVVAPSGEVEWLYEIRDVEPMSQSSWSTLGSWCDEYRLVFDQAGVLRGWTHRSYLHGGELMPISCNSAVGVEKPAL